jgi:hypothetical protein
MKNATKLGDLELQVTFLFPGQKIKYRTLTYPQRSGNKYWGNRSCLNLSTNKAENLECKKEVIHVEHK